MKRAIGLMVALGIGCATAAGAAAKPNVVFILVDDLGWTDLGCFGSSFYDTPNLDRLAADGARFTDAYAACAVCSPTRASLMTGRWPQRTGVTHYIGAAAPEAWKRNTKMLPAPYSDRLAHDEVTLAEMMKRGGYATFFAGKWHLGPEGWWPEDQGFDHNLGGHDRGGPYGGKKYFSPYGNPRLSDGPDGEHLPDRLAAETARFIETNKDRPFFAYLSFYSVHTPLMAREDLQKKYEERRAKLGLETRWGIEDTRPVRLTQDHAVYAGMIEAMDQAVGRVLAKLDELKLRDSTLVLFTGDNGGLSTSEGWPTSNLPLRGGKGWIYEGGIREPTIARWPGVIRPGSVIATPVISPDFFPTLRDAAGIAPAATDPSDGMSLLPVFRGEPVAERALFWHFPHYGNQGDAPSAAIRRGDWKLVEWMEDNRFELFNLAADIGETIDLVAKEPDRASKLRDELRAWQKDVGAKFPTPNPAFDPSQRSGRAAPKDIATMPDEQPNFVIINIDDLGYADIGPFGSDNPTPALDRMAKEGRLLASHYAAPVCTPSRAALMTGSYPKRALPTPHVLFPSGAIGLHPDEITIADALKSAGYATACFGKWHLGDQPEFLPTRQGFDVYFGIPYSNDMGPAGDGAKSNLGDPLPDPSKAKPAVVDEAGIRGMLQPPMPLVENETVVGRVLQAEQAQVTRLYTERAEAFIRENKNRPFFVYLPHSAVHFPLYPSAEFAGRSPNGLIGDWAVEVDWSVGRVLDTLRELGLDKKTLVIFTSDNGGSLRHGSNNGPLRDGKGTTHEGGIRTCTLAWWPGRIPAGTRTDAITTMMDILPTFAGLSGAKLPAGRRIDGVDIWSVLSGNDALPPPRDTFHYFRGLTLEAVRQGPWKLRFGKTTELYNLEQDLGETTNVADLNPEVVAKLRALADAMAADLGIGEELGPGAREKGRVENPKPLIPFD